MNVYYATDHDGHWPVGTASVIVATDPTEARRLLDAALVAAFLKPHAEEPYTLIELDTSKGQAVILRDGDY